MEGIEAEIENKSIEKSVEIKEVETPKPKKPRSQAQKDAFEKARKKRAENLLKKKEEEEEYEYEEEVVEDIKPPPKRRGRPKKAMKNQEPKQVSFIPPPDPQLYSQYPYQNQPQFNPYQYWGGVPPQQTQAPAPAPQPVNNYYYYGTEQHTPHQNSNTQSYREPEPSPDGSVYSSEEEEEYIVYPPTEPQLKYRFA
tara:strand:- start:4586 stop:5173 length:588 start_codon:yes stop_codon:yes gene_type:complete